MALKPDGQSWVIREQIIDDPVSGLTLLFEVTGGLTKLKIYGDLPFGTRDFIFDQEGQEAGAGSALADSCRPSWLREITS